MKKFIKSRLEYDLMEVFVKHGLLPETQLRNAKIRHEFEEIKDSGMSRTKAKKMLAEKYFLGYKSIEAIIYGS